jgi:hydroxyacyl-ACP dehydratase HTD2-like protein with hotdog domain
VIKSRKMIWAGHVSCVGERRGVYRNSVSKPEGKRPLGRPRSRWEDNIKKDPREVGVWTGLIRLRIGTGGGHLLMR